MKPIEEIKEKLKEKYQQEMRIVNRSSDDYAFALLHKEKAMVYFDCFCMLSDGTYLQIKEEIEK